MVSTSKVPWLQKVGSGIPQALQWGHRNHQDGYHCCPIPENQPLQRCCCYFTPGKTFVCLHELGKLTRGTVCKTPHWSAASIHSTKCRDILGAGQAQPHIPTTHFLFFHLLTLPTKLLFPIHSFFFFFLIFSVLLAEAASLWQELEWEEVPQNPPACSLRNVQGPEVRSWDSFHELATKHWKAPKKLLIVLWGAEGLCTAWLLSEEDRPALCLPQRHRMRGLHKDEEGSRHTWHWKPTEELWAGGHRSGSAWLWARAEEWLRSICRVQREAGALHGHQPSLVQKWSSRRLPCGANVGLQTYRLEMQSPDPGAPALPFCVGGKKGVLEVQLKPNPTQTGEQNLQDEFSFWQLKSHQALLWALQSSFGCSPEPLWG